jgi:hypothetical protein
MSKFDQSNLVKDREYPVRGHLLLNGTRVTGFAADTVVVAAETKSGP